MEYCILVVNPGSTSTKIAVFQGEKALLQKTIRHSGEELAPFGAIMDQAPFRLRCVEQALGRVRPDPAGRGVRPGRHAAGLPPAGPSPWTRT